MDALENSGGDQWFAWLRRKRIKSTPDMQASNWAVAFLEAFFHGRKQA